MKIYEIGTGYTPIPARMGAATEIVVEELTRSFKKEKYDVQIIDIKANNRKKNDLPIVEVNVPKIFLKTDVSLGIMHKLKRVIYSINLAFKLKKILYNSTEKVILHFHNQYNMFFFLLTTSKKIRNKYFLAYTNHSYIWHNEWAEIKKIVYKKYFQEIISMKAADKVYVLNEHTVNTLVTHLGIKEDKVVLINNGVNTDVYHPLTPNEIEKNKKKFNLLNKKVYLQVGSVCDRKNQLESLRLILPFLKENKESVFIYVGGIISIEYQKAIKEFSKNNLIEDQVIYLGEISPGKVLNEYYNLADVMVFPSKSEGFSLVIIEAMASGVPVIINKELQFELSDKCLKYSNDDEFASIIRNEILNIERHNTLSKSVREAVLKTYNWDKVSLDYYATWK